MITMMATIIMMVMTISTCWGFKRTCTIWRAAAQGYWGCQSVVASPTRVGRHKSYWKFVNTYGRLLNTVTKHTCSDVDCPAHCWHLEAVRKRDPTFDNILKSLWGNILKYFWEEYPVLSNLSCSQTEVIVSWVWVGIQNSFILLIKLSFARFHSQKSYAYNTHQAIVGCFALLP